MKNNPDNIKFGEWLSALLEKEARIIEEWSNAQGDTLTEEFLGRFEKEDWEQLKKLIGKRKKHNA